MSTAWQYDCNFRRRHRRLKEIQGYDWVLIFSWLGALLLWGAFWWATFRLQYGAPCSVRSGVIAMITEASYSDNLGPALAYANNRPEGTDESFALYLANRGVRSTAQLQPSL